MRAQKQEADMGQANWPYSSLGKIKYPEVHSYGSVLHALVRGRMSVASGLTQSFCLYQNISTKTLDLAKQINQRIKKENYV